MNTLERLARGLLRPINPYAVSLLGLLTFFWGLWIVLPLWEVFSRASVYSRALEFAPEWAWGTWSTCCGFLILSGVWTGYTKLLSWSLGFAVWHWSTIAAMFWWGDWQNTAGMTYSFIALYAVFSFLNIKTNFVNRGVTHI